MIRTWLRSHGIRGMVFAALLMTWNAQASNAQQAKPDAKKKVFLEYRPSLRDGNNNRFDLKGPDADQCVKHDARGVRITLPAGFKDARQETGLRIQVDVRGDFEITMSFDLLHEPGPTEAGFGTRTTMGLWFDGPEKNRDVTISRIRNHVGATQFGGWAPTLTDEFGNKLPRIKYAPTDAKTGRLRLVREGADISYFFAEGADGEFQLFTQYAVTAADVKRIRLVGTTGGPKASLDVRITDLVIRAEEFPDLPVEMLANRANANGAAMPAERTSAWFVVGFLIAAGLLLLLLLVTATLWLLRMKARRDTFDAAISLACSGCGRRLIVNADLAGKKIKCSKCGTVELVA